MWVREPGKEVPGEKVSMSRGAVMPDPSIPAWPRGTWSQLAANREMPASGSMVFRTGHEDRDCSKLGRGKLLSQQPPTIMERRNEDADRRPIGMTSSETPGAVRSR